MIRKISKRAWQFVMAIVLLISQMGMLLSSMPYVAAEIPLATLDPTIKVTQNGCALKIEKTEEVKWELPRQPIDLVILQDTSGSFEDTISYVQSALKTLTKPVSLEDYDEKEPRLVFTGNKDTTDRVMINTFQGIDGSNYYYDSDFKIFSHLNVQQDGAYRYQYRNTELLTSETEINQFIDKFNTIGGTPTVPAIDDTIARYNSIKGDMKNNRKTIFLLITDGVANGFRSQNGQVLMDRSIERGTLLRNEFIREGVVDSQRYVPEAQQDYIKRAQELKEAGQRLEALVKSNDQNDKNDGAVIVGFWEDIKIFTTGSSYGTTYQDGSVFEKVGIDVGADKRSVQEVFHEALKSVATSEQYYVNEQANPQAFSDKILKAVTQALVKENVEGTFQITEGYKVDSVTINDKTVVENVTDEATQIQGKVTQNGTTVTISVPESVFNPGNNKFDYLLSRTEDVENIAEEDEEEPSDDYAPQQVERQVGQLTGTFKVGDYESAEIGSKEPTTVTVTDLKYCYPNVSKDVKDKDATNDLGIVDDPIIAKKKSYAANLTTDNETFTYKILYRMNNAPLEFDKNAMLVDRLDYRIAYKNAYVTDVDGNRIDKFTIKTKDVVDVATGQTQTVVYATIPEDPGVNTETIKEGQYGNHKFKRYYLVVEAQLKDEYSFDNNPDEYKKILQENDGLGLMNQATILWNGSEDPVDPNAKTRRSNTVYVLPPVKTDIKKDVQSVEGTTGDYVKGQEQLYLSARTQEYFYNVESVWPGLADSYILSDTLVPELEFVTAYGNGGAKITVNGKEVKSLTDKLVVTGNTVKLELTKADFTGRTIARQIATANKGNNGPAVIKLTIKAKIKDGADLSKYAVGGQIKVPNKAQVELNGKPQESNEVYVTPDEPAPSKKINSTLDVLNTTKSDEAFEFNIQTKLPRDIQKYQSYKISDKLDNRLELTNQPAPYIKGNAAQYFDVTYDEASHTVVATAKTASLASMMGGETVELVIPAKIKDGTAIEKIPNTATIFYQTPSSGGEKETPPTPPVHVTPPPTIDKKVNNETHYNLTEATEAFTYTIETQVPDGATSFVISDKLVDVLEFDGEKGGVTVQINGTDVTAATTITAENKTLEVALSADQLKNNVGQKVLVTFKAKVIEGSDLSNYIKEGVAKVPNTASYIINTDPKTKKETKPVTVTPPGEASEPQKTVNDQQSAQLSNLEEVFTYKVTAQVPTNTAGFTKFELSDDLEDILTVTETSVTVGDATLDQKVTVTSPEEANTANGNVTASLSSNDIAKFAGKTVTLTIKARLKEGVTAEELAKYVTADNVAGSIPNRATLTVGDKPNQTKESENVPVTPPSETPSITKKINGNLEHLDTETATDYSYNIKVKVPADITSYKKFVIRDELNADLAIQGTPVISEPATQYFDVKVEGQLVTATMKNFAAAQELAGKEVELVIVSQIRKGVTTQNIPNTAEVVYQNRNHVEGTPDGKNDTPPVTVTPPGETPTVEKKINRDLTEAVVLPESNYTYNITSTLPVDITSYKAYAIVDELDENLSIQGTPVVTGDAAKFFDVTVTGNTVKATMKDFKQAKDLAGKQVELVITAQVKSTSTATKIDNTAKVTYQNKNHVDGEPDSETPPTPPVTVTTPPVTKKINENLDHLDTATQTNYTYNIKTVLPTDIATYKRFVITDSLEGELAVQGIPTMTGDAAKFFDVKVDGQVVTATITDFEAAKAMAGKEVELVIVSQIREGVTRQAIPNQTTISYTNKAKADGTPGDVTTTPPTPPVTVTPPGETPTVEKKINRDLDHLDIETEKDYNYNITTNLPVDIVSYKRYVLTDTLDQDLAIQGTPVITGEAAKFFDVTVEGQTVTATMKDFKQAKDLAGKQVELVITAQVREGITRPNIPNTAKVEFTNKSDQTGEKETKPVTVTPPTPNTPPIEKKVNGAASAELASRQEVFTYTIDTVVPTGAFAFEVNDTLEDVLAFEGEVTATLAGKALSANQITVAGQTVTVKLTKEQVRQQAGAPLQVVFFAKVKDGADLTPYMTDGRTSVPNTASYIINNDPSTKKDSNTVPVYPPTPNEPSVDKKINRDLTHLDVEVNKSYMYNVTADLPQDIATYKEFVVTDIVEPVLAINGEVVAYVDGYATDAVKVTVEGNRVVASVVDFSRLAGFKQIQLYIPAYIKSDADLTAYMKDNAASIPNTASLDFTDSNGVKKRKETTPVTVTPPTPDTPPTPPVNPPQPGTPVKTVSRVAGLEQTDYLALLLATENFRFDIKSVVPMDEADDKRLNLTSLTITDQMDNLFTVSPDKVAVKVTNAPTANANYIDEDVEKAQAALDVEVAKLEEIKQSAQTDTSAAALTEAQNLLATLEAEWTAAEAKLAELTTAELTEAPVETPAVDYASEIAAQEALMAELQAKLDEAKTQVQTAQAALSTAKTAAEVKVEVENQEKVVAEKQAVLDEAKKRQAMVQERIAQLANVNEKGELTAQAIVALGGSIKVEGQLVTVDFTDEYTMEALKGYTVNVIIYSSISDVDALTKDHFTIGIDNTATVQFNHDPSEQLTKKTNKVTVVPPKNDTPPPPPTTPEKPKGELPTPPTPPTTPPAESTPPPPGKTLPKTGVAENGMYALVGMILGTLTLVFRRRKQ
ncbi:isopeptide-forming domain-containing fimbrial protein [Streptococcus suis]|nr:isopeptide-forming domain-containing fimbrial protein [Streptococcus suis]